jgi:ankyrin repeat protein
MFPSNPSLKVMILSLILPLSISSFAQNQRMYDAIQNFELDTVKALVQSGYPINSGYALYGDELLYPLEYASYCYGGSAAIVEYLLDNGADVNLHTPGDNSPLMWALRSSDSVDDKMREMAKRMIEMGANATYRTSITGRTPLHGAAGNGDRELVMMLIMRGADKTIKANPGWDDGTPADYARQGGHVELALELEGKNVVAYRDTLHYAAKNGDLAKTRSLISRGANLDEQEPVSFYTPLHYAAMHDQPEVAKALLDAGANPNLMSYAGTSPLREAVVKYHREVSMALIAAGAYATNPQSQGCGGGMDEMDWALEYGQYDIAKAMVEAGATNVQGTRYIFRLNGTGQRDIDMAQYLIDRGARVTQKQIDWFTKYADTDLEWEFITLISRYKEAETDAFSEMAFGVSLQLEDPSFRDREGRLSPNAAPVGFN